MISLKKLGTSAGYGALDLATEWADSELAKKNPSIRKPFQNTTDIQRAVAFLGGVGATYFLRDPRITEIAETVAIASIPLLEKSIYNAVKTSLPGGTKGRLVLRYPGTVEQQLGVVRVPVETNLF